MQHGQEKDDPKHPSKPDSCSGTRPADAGQEFRRSELRLLAGRSAQRVRSDVCCAPTRPVSRVVRSISTSRNSSRRSAPRISAVPMTSSPQAISWRRCVVASARKKHNARASAWSESTLEPVAIGRLERWVGDYAIKEKWTSIPLYRAEWLQDWNCRFGTRRHGLCGGHGQSRM